MRIFTIFLTCLLSLGFGYAQTVKIMSYNIRGGVSINDIRNLGNTANVISTINPDIVALQEIDSVTTRNNMVNTMEVLCDMTGMNAIFSKAIDFQGGGYGIGLLCKEKPLSVERVALPGREERRTLIVAEFDGYIFLATHLSLTSEDRAASIAIMADIARKAKKPVFVAGDLNFSPRDELYKEFETNFCVLSGTEPTFPADKPSTCIDYIATSRGGQFYAEPIQTEVVNAPYQSDHRPIVATVKYGNIARTTPYLQNPTGGGITIYWQTNVPCHSYVECGTDTTNLTRITPLVQGQANIGTNNKVRLSVEPGKHYYYRTVSNHITHYGPYKKSFGGSVTSPFYSFSLPKGDDFTALVFNDLHQRRGTLDTLVAMLQNRGVNYDYIIFNGDCIDDPGSLDQALATMQYFNDKLGCSSIPTIFIRGNHEIRGAFSVAFNSIVDYPGGEHCYGAFNIGSTRFVILDSGEDKPDAHPAYYGLNDFAQYRKDQAVFLASELSSSDFKKAKHRVLMHHIPLYGQPEEWKNLAYDYWKDALVAAPFDVAINGHTHQSTFYKKGEVGNNFPIIVGGGYQVDDATVMIVDNNKNRLTVKCLDSGGELLSEVK